MALTFDNFYPTGGEAVTADNFGLFTLDDVEVDNSTATVAGSFPIVAGGTFEDRDYTGAVRAISGTAGQDVRIWEVG